MSERDPGYLRIGELARRTGTSPALLRAWERRYGLLHPARSQGGFRLYTTADEAQIHRMQDHLARGVAAAEAARLAIHAAAAGRQAGTPQADIPPSAAAAASLPPLQAAARELTAALDRFQEEPAHAVLDRLLAAYRTETILRDLLVPYLHDLGERWARGEVSVAQEHFAANLLRGRLLGLARGWGQGHGPTAVLACLPGEQHELGLLAFGVTLYRRGWRIVYLGPDTPIATIHQATTELGPELVVLTATVPEPFAAHADAIAGLARHTPVAVAGAGATANLAAHTGARLLDTDPVTAAESMDPPCPDRGTHQRHPTQPESPGAFPRSSTTSPRRQAGQCFLSGQHDSGRPTGFASSSDRWQAPARLRELRSHRRPHVRGASELGGDQLRHALASAAG